MTLQIVYIAGSAKQSDQQDNNLPATENVSTLGSIRHIASKVVKLYRVAVTARSVPESTVARNTAAIENAV